MTVGRGNWCRGRPIVAVTVAVLCAGLTACSGSSTNEPQSTPPNILRPYRGFDSWISFNGREPWRRLAAEIRAGE